MTFAQIPAGATVFVDANTFVSLQTGLLSNDALTVTILRDQGVDRLASNDADFDQIGGLTRYAPT